MPSSKRSKRTPATNDLFVRDGVLGIGAGIPVPTVAQRDPRWTAREGHRRDALTKWVRDVKGNLSTANDELVAAIYAAAAESVPPSRPLEILAELTRSDKAFYAHYDFLQQQGAVLASFNVEPHNIDSYRDIYASQNPWLARASYFQAEGLVWRGSDIVDLPRLRETEFYKLFLYGQVIENTAHLVIRVRGADLLHVMLTRRRDAEDYDEGAIEICRLYAFHARRALEISDTAVNWRFMEEGFSAAADEVATGVALVQAPATVLHMNRTFSALLNGGSASQPSPFKPGMPPRLPGRRPMQARLPRPLIDALAARPVPTFCLVDPVDHEDERPIPVLIRPVQLQGSADGRAPNGFLLICRSSKSEIEVDEGALRTAYALTAAEARVCAALVGGENVHVLSEHLGISPQTARTHLKRIYDKTETTRQPELLRLLFAFSHRKLPKPAPTVLADRSGLVKSAAFPWLSGKSLSQKG